MTRAPSQGALAWVALASAGLAVAVLAGAFLDGRGLSARFLAPAPTVAGIPSGPGLAGRDLLPGPGETTAGLLCEEFPTADLVGPTAATITRSIGMEPSASAERGPRSARLTGYLRVDRPGLHGFELEGEDGSALVIDGRPVVTEWGDHPPLARSGRVWLDTGLHPIRLDAYRRAGPPLCRVRWQPPGAGPGPVPGGVLVDTARGACGGQRLSPARGPQAALSPGVVAETYLHAVHPDRLLEARHVEHPHAPRPVAEELVRECPYLTRTGAWGACPLVDRFEGYVSMQASGRVRWELSGGPQPGLQPGAMRLDGRPVPLGPAPPGLVWAGAPPGPGHSRGQVPIVGEADLGPGDHHFVLTAIRDGLGARPGLRVIVDPPGAAGRPVVGVPTLPRMEWPWLGREGATLHTRVDHGLSFRADLDLLVPYVYRWDVARLGHPTWRPAVRAVWEGYLVVPSAGERVLVVEGTGSVALAVGAEPAVVKGPRAGAIRCSVALPEGRVPVRVDYEHVGPRHALALSWGPRGGPQSSLAGGDLAPGPRRGPSILTGMACLWLVFLAAMAAHAAGGLRRVASLVARPDPAGHGRPLAGLAAAAIVAAGLALRLHDLEVTPGPGECADEYNHHFVGHQLLAGEPPAGWEWYGRYPVHQKVVFHGVLLEMVAPMVFYPPGFSLLVGIVNRAAGARSMFEVRLDWTRRLAVGLAAATLALLYPLGRRVGLSPPAVLLGMAWFAVEPAGVVAGRLVKEESLLSYLLVSVTLLIVVHAASPSAAVRWVMGAAIGASVLTKQVGIGVGAFAVIALGAVRQWRAAGLAALFAVLGVTAWIAWGIGWGAGTFVGLQADLWEWAGRPPPTPSANVFWPLLTQSRALERDLVHAWLLGGWILFLLAAARRRLGLVALAVLTYLAVLAAAYPAGRNFGWYRLPLYPLLALAWGEEAWTMVRRADPLRILVFLALFLLPGASLLGLPPAEAGVGLARGAIVAWLLLALVRASGDPWGVGVTRMAAACVVAVVLAQGVIAVLDARTLLPPVGLVQPGRVHDPLGPVGGAP